MTNVFEHIYTTVINLEKDGDRRTFMEDELTRLSIPHGFLAAINGQEYDFTGIYDEAQTIKLNGAPLTAPEKGCALSHRIALERFLASEKQYGLILEDDVVLDHHFSNAVAYCLSKKDSWTYVQFNYGPVGFQGVVLWWFLLRNRHIRTVEMPLILVKGLTANALSLLWGLRNAWYRMLKRKTLATLVRDQYLAGCYLLTREAAGAIISLNTPLTYTADRIQNIARRKGLIKERVYIPRIVRQKRESFASSINNAHFGKDIIAA